MEDFKKYIKELSIECLEYLSYIYKFEANCEIDEYAKKIKLIEEEVRLRVDKLSKLNS